MPFHKADEKKPKGGSVSPSSAPANGDPFEDVLRNSAGKNVANGVVLVEKSDGDMMNGNVLLQQGHGSVEGTIEGEKHSSPLVNNAGTDGERAEVDENGNVTSSQGGDELEEGEDYDWAKPVVDDEVPENMVDDSPSRLEWLRQKREENQRNRWMDRIMSIVGHEEVKAHFLTVKTRVEVAKRWNEDIRQLQLDLILYGNPGTGKKMIAHIYARFLYSIGAVHRPIFRKRDIYTMPNEEEGATVVFFSNADSIDRWPEIDSILGAVQRCTHNLVLILAYRRFSRESRMILKRSPEALNRFPDSIQLHDYTEGELAQLLVRLLKKRSIEIEGGLDGPGLRLLAKRALTPARTPNIHALEAELDDAYRRQTKLHEQEWVEWARRNRPEDSGRQVLQVKQQWQCPGTISKKAIIGPEPTDIVKPRDVRNKSAAWKEIQHMVGLEDVKKEVEFLFDHAISNYDRKMQHKDLIPTNLNRVFLGASGVGKSTVAELYARIVGELGLVSKGQVIVKNPGDLISVDIGGSEENTREALEEARGNILILDDAHMLYRREGGGSPDVYRLGIIDTLVANISGKPGEDRCVILVGSKDILEEMLVRSNAGLRRRFPPESAIRFESFSDDQLCQILDSKLAVDNTQVSEHGRRVAREVLSRRRVLPNFGNAGDVEALLSQAKMRQRHRKRDVDSNDAGAHDERITLEPEDFDPNHERGSQADKNRNALFDGFVGFDKITKQFEMYQQMVQGMRSYGVDPKPYVPWAFIFKGPPGSGKTSTATKIGQLFYDMGFLGSNEVITCSVTDLIAQYVGQTGPKVIEKLELGLGKVLFIDEAYRLAAGPRQESSSFAREAIGELVDAMTRPRYVGNMVIVLAGYTEDMEYLLRSNQGLRSRFPTQLSFPRLESRHCVTLLKQVLSKVKINVEEEASHDEKWSDVYEIFDQLTVTEGWANGRDIETLGANIIRHMYMMASLGQVGTEEGQLTVSAHHLVDFLRDLLRERKSAPSEDYQ